MKKRSSPGRGRPPLPPDLDSATGRLAARIRQIRMERGINVATVVLRFNSLRREGQKKITPRAYYNWEQAKNRLHYEQLTLLAQVFDVTMSELTGE